MNRIIEFVRKNDIRSVCIEAAHIYSDEKVNTEHLQSAKLGAELSKLLDSEKVLVKNMLFIDDYHPKSHILNINEYLDMLVSQGFIPDLVVWEKDLALMATNLTYSLNGQTQKEAGRISLIKPNLTLINADGELSCNILDATLYASKFSLFQLSITVLPATFKGQQKNVRKVLKALGYDTTPMANVFFESDGNINVKI